MYPLAMSKAFCILSAAFFLTLGAQKIEAQVFYFESRDAQRIILRDLMVTPANEIIINRGGFQNNAILLYNSNGSLIKSVLLSQFGLRHFVKVNAQYVGLAESAIVYNPDSIFFLVYDSSLNLQATNVPVKINWPRRIMAVTSSEAPYFNDSYALFSTFTDSAFTETNKVYGWLLPNASFDTLFAQSNTFETNQHSIIRITQTDIGYVARSTVEHALPQTWSPTINVTKILHLDSNLQLKRANNFFAHSSIPNYPRVLASTGVTNLIVNEHSVYGLSEYEALAPFPSSNTAMSFALYQFDHTLNIKKVKHQLASPGRWAETSLGGTRSITFDHTKTHIYAIGNDCEPAVSFNNQDRTCAIVVMKYDTAMNLVWRKNIELPKIYFHADVVTTTDDGGVLVGGSRIDSAPNANIDFIFVMKLDSAGNHSVSVNEQPKSNHRVFPNPATSQLQIQWDHGLYTKMVILNMQGQEVAQMPVDNHSNLLQLNIESLPPGLYLYRMEHVSGSSAIQGKFVKH